ncbi:MAG: cache domain-containing protein [Spirochaetes bacterium]|nr:cache domain-containing protein [Spirochaetota bacterium]
MKAARRRTLLFPVLAMLVLVGVVSATLVGVAWNISIAIRFGHETAELRARYIGEGKLRIGEEVSFAAEFIRQRIRSSGTQLEAALRNRVDETWRMVSLIYEREGKGLSRATLERRIIEFLRPLRYNDGRGYYFIVRLDGTELLYPVATEFEGKSVISLRDDEGKAVIADELAVVNGKGAGFVKARWKKPGSGDALYDKLSYVRVFEPLDWYLGTGEYLDELRAIDQRDAVEWLSTVRFAEDGYLFASTLDGDQLFSNGKVTVGGKSLQDLVDPNGVRIFDEQRTRIDSPEGGGFFSYSWPMLAGGEPVEKISYVTSIPEWGWIVGSGFYLGEIERLMAARRLELERELLSGVFIVVAISAFAVLAGIGLAILASRTGLRKLGASLVSFERSAAELEPIALGSDEYGELAAIAESVNRIIEARRRIEKTLEKSLAEKETLLKEIHHRVKNNLQIVSSLLSLQLGTIRDGKGAAEAIRDSWSRIRSMSLVHELMYRSTDLALVELGSYIGELVVQIRTMYVDAEGSVAIATSFEPLFLAADRLVPLALIVNETITNAFQHAFPSGRSGIVTVCGADHGDGYEIEVSDDGVGLPIDFFPERGDSLGFKLIEGLSGQISASFRYERRSPGSAFIIRLQRDDSRTGAEGSSSGDASA